MYLGCSQSTEHPSVNAYKDEKAILCPSPGDTMVYQQLKHPIQFGALSREYNLFACVTQGLAGATGVAAAAEGAEEYSNRLIA
jgi:hypothetical protein